MKTLFKLFFILFVSVICFTCEKEELQELNPTSESSDEATAIYINGPMSSFVIGSNDKDGSDEIDLHNRMQWISFITAQALMRSTDALQQFEDEVVNSGSLNAFHIKELLEDDVINESFRNEFRDVFYLYYNGTDTCTGNGKPKGGPKPPGEIGGTPPGTIPPTPFDLYVSSILNDDCFEFYLPNGFNPLVSLEGGTLNQIVFVKSTAHPLTNATSNEGYHHSSNNASSCAVSKITVNDNTIAFTIVVRPIVSIAPQCAYDKYTVDDYQDFLD